MTMLKLDELQPGMVLASDAICLNGRVLLRAGATLTEKHLRIFRTWGLNEADIEGVDAESIFNKKLAAVDPIIVEKETLILNERFLHTDKDHPFIDRLFHWCLEHALAKVPK